MILDVGCGGSPCGDVNCDLLQAEGDRMWDQIPQKINNFVKCDVRALPFKSNAFSHVHCSHLIEHLEDEWEGINELLRVSCGSVKVIVPYSVFRILDPLIHIRDFPGWRAWEKKNHKHFWYNDPFNQGKGNWNLSWAKREKGIKRLNKFAAILNIMWIPFETETIFRSCNQFE